MSRASTTLAFKRLRHLTPPEGVPIAFAIASMGARIGAQLLDILITYLGSFLLLLLVIWLGILSWSALGALFVLMTFFLRAPYYILSELVWNGRTLGKRLVGIRVVSVDGRRLTPHQIVARNLMKEVEVFLPIATIFGAVDNPGVADILLLVWFLAVLVVPFVNKRNQRLGDMMAGTLVVETPKSVLLPDLSLEPRSAGAAYEFRAEHLDVYGRYELQVLEDILRSPPRTPDAEKRLSEVAQTIRRRIRYDEVIPPSREWEFLRAFYRQQREYLESRHLFGDTRESKNRPATPR